MRANREGPRHHIAKRENKLSSSDVRRHVTLPREDAMQGQVAPTGEFGRKGQLWGKYSRNP